MAYLTINPDSFGLSTNKILSFGYSGTIGINADNVSSYDILSLYARTDMGQMGSESTVPKKFLGQALCCTSILRDEDH